MTDFQYDNEYLSCLVCLVLKAIDLEITICLQKFHFEIIKTKTFEEMSLE